VGISDMKAFWVLSGPSLTCGARAIGDDHQLGPARKGTMWLDVCILGQHLPQMYRVTEVRELTAEACASLGLCDKCLGWGDSGGTDAREVLYAARRVDEVRQPCPGCASGLRDGCEQRTHRADKAPAARLRASAEGRGPGDAPAVRGT
jgi:hypothetical protein